MAVIAHFLIDTSAAARMRLAAVADQLGPLVTGGLVVTCATLDVEALHSARSPAEFERVRADRRDADEYLPGDERALAACPRRPACIGWHWAASSGGHR